MTDEEGIGIIGNRATEPSFAIGFIVPCGVCGEKMHVSNASFRDAQKLGGPIRFMCVPCAMKAPPGDVMQPGEETIKEVAARTGLPEEVVRERLFEITDRLQEAENAKEPEGDNRDKG